MTPTPGPALAAHLRRRAAALDPARRRDGPARRAPPRDARAARVARPPDRADSTALPGGRRARPQPALPPLRPALRRRGPGPSTSDRMRRLANELAGPHRDAERIAELVGCPLPLVPILAEDDLFGETPTPGGLVEVLLRRYYKIRELGPLVHGDDGVLRTSYEHRDRTVRVLAARVDGDLAEAFARIQRAAAEIDGPDTAVVDLYLEPRGERSRRRRRPRRRRCRRRWRRPGCRRRCGASRSSPGTRCAGSVVLTFRRADRRRTDFVEDETFRGLHPMIARRLQLWRLVQLRDHPPQHDRRRQRVRLRRPREPVRRAADRRRRGARPHAGARRGRQGDRPARGRERARRLPRRHPRTRATPGLRRLRVEPGHALRLADGRPAARRGVGHRPPPRRRSPRASGLEQVVVSRSPAVARRRRARSRP